VPLTIGTFSSQTGFAAPGALVVRTIVPLLDAVVLPLFCKANPVTAPVVNMFATPMAGVGGRLAVAFGKLGANAGAMRLGGAPGVGVMPVTVPVGRDPKAIAFPGVVVTLVSAGAAVVVTVVPLVKKLGAVGAVTPVTTGCVGAVTPVTALLNVGVTDVTTVWPAAPVTSPMTLAKVGLTLVTHVAAEAEDNGAVLRLPTVSAARSVWFEADANSANITAARRGTIVCFGLVIPALPKTCPE